MPAFGKTNSNARDGSDPREMKSGQGLSTSRHVISAPPIARAMCTSASKGLALATAKHELGSVDSQQTSAKIGATVALATRQDFQKLGVVVDTKSIRDCGATGICHDPVPETKTPGGLMYDISVTDSNAMAFSGQVYMPTAMQMQSTTLPMALHALNHMGKRNDQFKLATRYIHDNITLSFDTKRVDKTHTAACEKSSLDQSSHGNADESDIFSGLSSDLGLNHCSEAGMLHASETLTMNARHPATKRSFTLDTGNPTHHHLTAFSTTNEVRRHDGTPITSTTMDTHMLTQPTGSYVASQSVHIESAESKYNASVVMSVGGSTQQASLDSEKSAQQANAFTPFHSDNGFTKRDSTVHVFADGKHLALNVQHRLDADAPRSLHLPVYAALHALGTHTDSTDMVFTDTRAGNTHTETMGGSLETAPLRPTILPTNVVQAAMSSGYMETVCDGNSMPIVVLRESQIPIVAVVVPFLSNQTEIPIGAEGHTQREFEKIHANTYYRAAIQTSEKPENVRAIHQPTPSGSDTEVNNYCPSPAGSFDDLMPGVSDDPDELLGRGLEFNPWTTGGEYGPHGGESLSEYGGSQGVGSPRTGSVCSSGSDARNFDGAYPYTTPPSPVGSEYYPTAEVPRGSLSALPETVRLALMRRWNV